MSSRRAVPTARGARSASRRKGDALMVNVQGLRCRECGRDYDAAPIFTCEWCFGPLEVAYDYDAIRASVTREKIAAGPASLWRYSALLPVEGNSAVDLGTGFTPLVRADRLAS